MCNIIVSSKFLLIYDEVQSFYENPWKLKSIQSQCNDAQNVSSSSSNDLPACVKFLLPLDAMRSNIIYPTKEGPVQNKQENQ